MGVHHHKSPIVTDGLVFQVDADNDLSGNVSNVKNIVKPTETGSFVNGASVVDGVYDFDGVDDYIDNSSSITTVQSNSTGTVDAWVKLDTLTQGWIIGLGGDELNLEIFSLSVRDISGNFNFNVTSSPATDIVYADTNLVAGTWYNIVLTSNGSTWEFYINGEQDTTSVLLGVNSGVWFDAPNPTNPLLTLGAIKNNSVVSLFWDGKIANTKIYNKALTPTEIQQNYNATKNKYH